MTRPLPWKHIPATFMPLWMLLFALLFGGSHSLHAQLDVSFDVTQPVCATLPNGSVTAQASGGIPAYTYQWNTGATGPTISGISAGTYTVTITDAILQFIIRDVVVNEPSPVTATLTVDDFCESPFLITANPDGGISPYTYNWTSGQMTQTITGVSDVQYCVTVVDANQCGVIECITLNNNPPSVSVNTGSVTCPGGNNGTLTAFPSGGQPPFVYNWSNGDSGQTIFNLTAGSYTVTLTDAVGCSDTATGFVNQPPPIVINLNSSNPNCNGDTNGSITSSVTGGTPPYTLSWNTGQNTPNLFNLSPGTYVLTVTDANGCVETASVTLVYNSNLNLGGVGTPETCPGANNGFATASPQGGVTPYSYLWNNGQTGQVIANIAPGSYTVTVTDAVGCVAVNTINVAAAPAFNVTAAGNNPTTCGVNNGSATANITQGNGPFTFAWNTGANTQTIFNLGAGTYSVTVTNGNGCITNASTTLIAPPDVFVNITGTPTICPGSFTGTLTASVTGGTAPFVYSWNTGAAGQTLSGLGAGNYSVTVTDANGCMDTASFTITQTNPINVVVTGQTLICGPANTGSASAGVNGGTQPYTYLWNTGQTTATITNLPSGTYVVTVTDALGCSATGNITINIVSDLDVNLIPREVLCFGANNGSVLAQPSGGDAPYTYLWNNGATTNEITGLTAGTYTLTVTEANGCTVVRSTTVSQPPLLTVSTSFTNPSCPGDSDGTATVTPAGGTPGYTYAWSNGANTATITGVAAGTYTVTVMDTNLCPATASVTLTDPEGLDVNVTAPTIVCGGTSTGSATAIVTGGTGMYTYLWSDGQTTQTATDLIAGTYSLTVTDANGCSEIVSTIIVSELPEINVDFNVMNLECTSAPVGSITAIASNGTPPYTYAWNNGQTTQTISNLTAGTYTVTVTDANNCQVVRSAEVTQTAGFTVGVPGTNVKCFGDNDGTATAITNGGQPPFAYDWSNGANTQMVTGLAPGTYSVTVVDANECFATGSVVISEPALLVANLTGVDLDCNDADNGSVTVNPTGGTAPYTYLWSNGMTTQSIGNLSGGTYSVTVTDVNDCTATNSTTLTEPDALMVTITQNSGTCNNVNEGILVAMANGGTSGYTYAWNNGASGATISNLAPGVYTVTVTDANNCSETATAAVTTFPAPTCSVTVVQPSTLGNNGELMVNPADGTAPYTYLWSNGATTQTITGLAPGTYTATVTDDNGCQTTCSATLDLLAGLGNYVWEDIDHDGQQDADEPPVPGVTVNLKDADGNVIDNTVTDANGEYYFLGLDPGTYSVQFVIPDGFDYTIGDQGDDETDSDIVAGMNGMTINYTLDPGELDFTIDGGIYMPPNAVISDPCLCLNNSTNEFNGQFNETLTVRSYPNETWTIIDGIGMFDTSSPAPPLAPIPVSFPVTMTETEPGVYDYTFLLVDEISYTVIATNGFDTLSITNTCEYPTLNIEELPGTTLCVADAPIELGANPNIPGNLIFTVNGVITTTIDPFLLEVGNYELIATLIPLAVDECEATVITEFDISEDCLATVGDRVWLDLNCDGIQGGNEPGVPGVEVTLTGTSEFPNPDINLTTFTDANGNYSFVVPPGNYKITFGAVPGYEPTTPNQGSNDELDSDVNPVTLMTDFFHLDPFETNLSFDFGLCPECINIDYPGAIGYDQYLCAPGNDPEPFVSLAEPTGGDGPIEYLWMQTTGFPGTPIQYWTPIPNTNSPTYDAGPLFTTTYFARCARTEDCGPYLESNILIVEVGNETEAIINGPGLVCWNEPTTFTAEDLEPFSTVTWNFTGGATPATVNGPTATVTWTNVGTFQVELIVTLDGCTAYAYKTITITTAPTACSDGLVIDTDITNPEAAEVMVSWEMNASITGLTYHVERSADGVNFERVATVTEPTRALNGVRYFEFYTQATKRGLNYYRVEVEDESDNTVYSNIEEVIFYSDSKIAMLYPNPVDDLLNLEIFETFDADDVLLEIYAVSGKKMETIPVANGQRQMQLDFSNYPAGAYFVRLRLGETDIRTMKVIKRK